MVTQELKRRVQNIKLGKENKNVIEGKREGKFKEFPFSKKIKIKQKGKAYGNLNIQKYISHLHTRVSNTKSKVIQKLNH